MTTDRRTFLMMLAAVPLAARPVLPERRLQLKQPWSLVTRQHVPDERATVYAASFMRPEWGQQGLCGDVVMFDDDVSTRPVDELRGKFQNLYHSIVEYARESGMYSADFQAQIDAALLPFCHA